MPLNSEISGALQLLEHIQQTINDSEDVKLQAQTSEDLNLLISLLDNPIFHSVATIQDSLNELSYQIQKHPSILPVDFDLTAGGELVLKLPSPVYDEDGLIHPRSPATLNASVGTHAPPSTTRITPVPRDWDAEEDDERSVITVKLFKPDDRSLGFSIVSLRSMEKGEIGIFIQEIQPQGIAGMDGRLKKGDQILSIDGQPVGSNISHQQAISLLQKARGNVELIVARSNIPAAPSPTSRSPSPTGISDNSDGEEMAFNTEWGQVEVIDLVNDGCGLGFGITGDGRTGVVVKTLLPGGVADRDGRLKSGDHILQIGDVYLQGMGSEQVVEVLRQAGSRVRLVVNRPIEVNGNQMTPQLPARNQEYIEPDEGLDLNDSPCVLHESPPGMTTSHSSHSMYQEDFEIEEVVEEQICEIQKIENPTPPRKQSIPTPPRKQSMNDLFFLESHEPEMERFTVELKKDIRGLGITIAGYVCEKEELSGIFVKNISAGSVADVCKKIQVNDRIVEVDGQSLHGFTNHEAVEVLRSTGGTVRLTLERYLRGPKFQELQQAIANSELKPNTPPSPSTISLPCFPSGNEETPEPENPPLPMSFSALIPQIHTMSVEDDDVELLIDTDYEGVLKPTVEEAIKKKWRKVMGPDVDIVVGQLKKLNGGGLGISLEGTIDTENNKEIRRHHYIRSILPEGPVGKNGKLKSGDELLEVNGHRLFGMSHIEVVNILKELPLGVRMVCARHRDITPIQMLERYQPEHTLQVTSGLLEGNLQNLMPVTDRLVKAKSDGCLASTATSEPNLGKHRSKSLEPIAGLAMWSSEPHIIELVKGEHGLGFSILDYQDPLNPNETVIVIRSLVPGGVAQADGRLIPGDRLLAVNSVALDNASLDKAVQALKGAPKGIVRIVVAKPLPITETAP